MWEPRLLPFRRMLPFRCLWFVAALAPVTSAIVIESNVPFQVVRPTANHTSMVPVSEGLRRLAQHEQPISVISVVGPYHSGKSFLLNSLVGETGVFQIGRRTDPETMGIWLCRTDFKAQDGSEVWLMDSEGFFGPSVGETYDAKIFTIATLLGAHLVYNSVKVIDQQAVNLLEMLARRAQLFRTRSSAEVSETDMPDFLSVRSFPPLTWVVEDFVQELPHEYRIGGGATAWLKSYLSKINGTSAGDDHHVHFLSKLYSDLHVHTLFLPATARHQLQDLSKVPWDQLTPEFKEEVEALRRSILQSLIARRFEGAPMTGQSLQRALQFIVQALQRGMFHDLPSLWSTWSTQVADMSLNDADTWFASLLVHIDADEDPIPVAEFNANVEDARGKTKRFYEDLLRDFEVALQHNELRNRMAVHFDHKVMHYHERVRRWVSDVINKQKDEVTQFLASMELPLDPDVLKRQADNISIAYTKSFGTTLANFAAKGPPVTLGRQAQMPAFNQDPAAQLAGDLRTLQGTRELENEREIMQVFKAAVAAADEAVEAELKSSTNRLVGKARMKELMKVVERRCWAAFDEVLVKRKWMMLLHHYRTHKALVQTETFESRTSRFVAANDQRLSAHFRTALERTVNAYKTKQTALSGVMPISETELDTEHRQLRTSIREMLEEQAKDLTDTDAFARSLRSLTTVLDEGYEDVRQKNIDLWTVHSDQARKCALRWNHAVEQHCTLFCLFNKVPRVHKTTSQKHLFDCFSQASVGSRMSPNMQMQVFENWYSKDLAQDATRVWNHFYILSALVGVVVLFFASVCARLRSAPPPTYYGPQGTPTWPAQTPTWPAQTSTFAGQTSTWPGNNQNLGRGWRGF